MQLISCLYVLFAQGHGLWLKRGCDWMTFLPWRNEGERGHVRIGRRKQPSSLQDRAQPRANDFLVLSSEELERRRRLFHSQYDVVHHDSSRGHILDVNRGSNAAYEWVTGLPRYSSATQKLLLRLRNRRIPCVAPNAPAPRGCSAAERARSHSAQRCGRYRC